MSARRAVFWLAYAVGLWCWHLYLAETWAPPSIVAPHTELPERRQPMHEASLPPPSPKQLHHVSPVSSQVRLTASPPPPPPKVDHLSMCQSSAKGADVKEHRDLDGAVMVPGWGPGALSLPPERCCAECAKTRGCNVWVACMDEKACGKQCWLKWAEDPSKPAVRGENPAVPWASGTLLKDAPNLAQLPSTEQMDSTRIVKLETEFGDLRIALRPDWHLPSVTFVRQVALSDVCTIKCQFYRAEPGFLLQGAMRAVIAPNKLCRKFRGSPKECNDPEERPGGSVMERGDVAWAGGSAGPDFFITMNRVPGFGGSHTVWGRLADEESMQLALKLVQHKISPSVKPGEMRILDQPISFSVKKHS